MGNLTTSFLIDNMSFSLELVNGSHNMTSAPELRALTWR